MRVAARGQLKMMRAFLLPPTAPLPEDIPTCLMSVKWKSKAFKVDTYHLSIFIFYFLI